MAEPSILPATVESLSELAEIEGDDRCVLTVYFPGSAARDRKLPCKLTELPETLLPEAGLTHDETEHRSRSLDLWKTVVPKVHLPPAQGWVAVISWLTDHAVFVPLPSAVDPAAYLGNSPFLLPAARLMDDFEAYAVVYADHTRAAIYLAALGRLHDESSVRGDIKNHVRKGGWSQQRYERRRDKEIHYYCEAILERLTKLVRGEGLRRIVLAGNRLFLVELEKRMSPDMRDRVVSRLPMEDDQDARQVYRETLSAAAADEEREEKRLLGAIRGEHAAGGKAVVGPADTLAALKEKRVRRLLIGPMDEIAFWRCGGCGTFGLGGAGDCPACGQATYAQSAANEFMDIAFAGASEVEFSTNPLPEINGVAALLRW